MSLVARVIRTSAPGDNPKIAPMAERARFDLQLAGHTHAGQVFPWTFVIHLVHGPAAPGAKLAPPQFASVRLRCATT
jgi:hypothetical protein